MRTKTAFLLALAAALPVYCPAAAPTANASAAIGWNQVPAILSRIKAPEFPDRDFPITDYGAKPDGKTDCTAAIRKAIEACHAAGGGRVVVAGGTFLTGAVHLLSNVNLHIAKGATLKFSPDPQKYLPVVYTRYEGIECMNYSPLIYAFGQRNIAVTGHGTLDGSASDKNWWAWIRPGGGSRASINLLHKEGASGMPVAHRVFGSSQKLRPNFLQPYRCQNVLIADVHIVNSPMWEINPVLCTNVTVRGVNISSHGPNNDGCDPECSSDVLIEHCLFDTGDDCIAIKSGRNADGRRVNVPSQNIIVRDCTMKDGHGGVVVGSEVSGGVRNVFAENCKMSSPNLDRALRIKTNPERGGFVENVFMRNVQVGQVARAVLTINLQYGRVSSGPFNPVVRNVTMQNVTAEMSPRVLAVIGTPKSTIQNVRLVNCTFHHVEGANLLAHTGSVTYQNVTVEPAEAGAKP